jgi:hypothetical protein
MEDASTGNSTRRKDRQLKLMPLYPEGALCALVFSSLGSWL